jgi:hypothetical protein
MLMEAQQETKPNENFTKQALLLCNPEYLE